MDAHQGCDKSTRIALHAKGAVGNAGVSDVEQVEIRSHLRARGVQQCPQPNAGTINLLQVARVGSIPHGERLYREVAYLCKNLLYLYTPCYERHFSFFNACFLCHSGNISAQEFRMLQDCANVRSEVHFAIFYRRFKQKFTETKDMVEAGTQLMLRFPFLSEASIHDVTDSTAEIKYVVNSLAFALSLFICKDARARQHRRMHRSGTAHKSMIASILLLPVTCREMLRSSVYMRVQFSNRNRIARQDWERLDPKWGAAAGENAASAIGPAYRASILAPCLTVLCLAGPYRLPSQTTARPQSQLQVESQLSSGRLTLLEVLNAVLNGHPALSIQQAQVEVARSLRLQNSSLFDTVLTAGIAQQRSAIPLTAAQQQTYSGFSAEQANITSVSAGVSRLFRSGIQLTATIPLSRDADGVAYPDGYNTAGPVLQITVPLLRGRGKNAVAAPEIAAGIEIEASEYDLTQELAQLVTVAAGDYFTLIAAQRLLDIGREAESRTRTDVENTETLVAADQIPRTNLNEVRANLEQARQTVVQLEQNLSAAQVQLATDMGLGPADVVALQPLAVEDLPDAQQDTLPNPTVPDLRSYVTLALTRRSDYLAAEKRVEEQTVLVKAARNQLLPVLNLTGSGGYNGLKEGHAFQDLFATAGSNPSQPNASVGLAYSFPPRNEYARGLLLQTTAVETQRRKQALEAGRSISNAIGIAAQAVYHNRLAVAAAAGAVASYRASLMGQREKFHLGIASVVDLITVENNLTLALNTEVQAQLNYALAIVQLRFATGTIVTPGGGLQQVRAEVFRTVPLPTP